MFVCFMLSHYPVQSFMRLNSLRLIAFTRSLFARFQSQHIGFYFLILSKCIHTWKYCHRVQCSLLIINRICLCIYKTMQERLLIEIKCAFSFVHWFCWVFLLFYTHTHTHRSQVYVNLVSRLFDLCVCICKTNALNYVCVWWCPLTRFTTFWFYLLKIPSHFLICTKEYLFNKILHIFENRKVTNVCICIIVFHSISNWN